MKNQFEKVEILNNSSKNWSPVVKETTHNLLNKVFQEDEESKKKVLKETIGILKLCGDPSLEENNNTGLVFGYVQSGKTLSFTTLTALAHDNDYQLVIVIAGTSKPLVNQSFSRLKKDLDLENAFYRKWQILKNPKDPNKNPQDKNTIKRELDNWKNNNTPDNLKKTVLITVMKNTSHLANLINVLEKIDLEGVPTLIIDDEGDQASMNTKASANARIAKKTGIPTETEMSTIYRRIRTLKLLIPHHTFLQYTATPQAPLFINLFDNLSPNFIQLLQPGDKYTGGYSFFRQYADLAKRIPESEILSEENMFPEAPQSLKEAMRLFFLGVASGMIKGRKEGNPKNRTMMVHPSRLTDDHDTYFDWVESLKNMWTLVLNERGKDDEFRIELESEFRNSYKDLSHTVKDLENFETLMHNMGHYIQSTALQQLNSKSGNQVDWGGNYAFILVGGQAMDRGFTVEGLTVTYMPRSMGVGNADTIQQRARFFGYKKDYIGYCRVYLDDNKLYLFSEYVDHEEYIRTKLLHHQASGKPLDDLKREVVLNEMYKLTRKNVLSENIERRTFGDNKWLRMNAPHDSEIIIDNNREAFIAFKNKNFTEFTVNSGHPKRTEEQIHLVGQFTLKKVLTEFLDKLKFTRQSDSNNYTTLKAVLGLYLEELPPEKCFIYLMKKGEKRIRSLSKKDEINNLFQGKNPKSGEVIYPGDMNIKHDDNITIQIHNLNILQQKEVIYSNVITIAVWIPSRLRKSLVKIRNNA